MEGRIIIYSQTSSRVSNFIYSLISLFPGAICFNYARHYHEAKTSNGNKQVLYHLNTLKEYGFPLQLFNSETQFIPLLSLQDVDILERLKGFLVGTTNPLLLNFPKAKADIVINLDNEKIEFPSEKSGSQL